MARWKAQCHFLLEIIERFSQALTATALLSEICRNQRFSERGGSFWEQILRRWGRCPQSVYGPVDRPLGEWCSYNFALEVFTQRNCIRLLSTEVELYWQKQQNRVLCHPLGDLGVTCTVHLWLIGKRVIDFLLVLILLFSPAVIRLTRCERILVEIVVFEREACHFQRKFQGEGG